MPRVQHKTAVLMPYAPLKDELDIGGIKFIPFQKLKVNPKIDKAITYLIFTRTFRMELINFKVERIIAVFTIIPKVSKIRGTEFI